MDIKESGHDCIGQKRYDLPLILVGLVCAYSLAVGYCMDPDDTIDKRPVAVQASPTIDDAVQDDYQVMR
ncbi:hypothetical protein JW968_06275 [Candidatus Woesearchaeota archaeon]|nr:hypothetical protein [Candidatus Woesearchaeota archaeon]